MRTHWHVAQAGPVFARGLAVLSDLNRYGSAPVSRWRAGPARRGLDFGIAGPAREELTRCASWPCDVRTLQGLEMVIHDTTHGLVPLRIDRNAATLSIAWTWKP